MDDWVQILSNQWYITLSTHETTYVSCEVNKLWEVYKWIIWSGVIGLTFSISMFSWIRSDCVLKNVINITKMSFKFGLLRSVPNISISTPLYTNHAHMCQQQDGFYFTLQFYFIYLKIHTSQISTIPTKIQA